MKEVKITVTGELIEEISKNKYEKLFPQNCTYGTDITNVFLENGKILYFNDWNGESYNEYYPKYCYIYDINGEVEQMVLIGYEIR